MRLLSLLLFVLFACWAFDGWGQAGHHGHGHDERHDWYKDLKQPLNGHSCCSKLQPDGTGDCRPTRAELREDGWWAALDGKWVPIPSEVILPATLNREGIYAHICANRYGYIFCFLPAGSGS